MKKLERVREHVFVYPYEEDIDRPNIGYITGDKINLAIEAGHSERHLEEFYTALDHNNLSLPDLTVVTHWHWDHTFAMHAVHGLTVAEQRTNEILCQIANRDSVEYQRKMMNMDLFIKAEYMNQRMIVVPADIVFADHMEINLGGIHAELFHIPSPHTDDCIAILIKEERVLFYGDAKSGPYPTYDNPDSAKTEALKQKLISIDFSLGIGGHWQPECKENVLNQL